MKYPLNLLEGTTPGPWILGDENDAWSQVCLGKSNCSVSLNRFADYPNAPGMSRNEKAANARLIAAAPTLARHLAEAIELLEDAASMFDNHEDAVTGETNPFREFLEKMEGERG